MNRTFSLLTLCILLAALLISLALDAAAAETRFRPEQFFAGRTRSSGVFANTFGKPHERFTTECLDEAALDSQRLIRGRDGQETRCG